MFIDYIRAIGRMNLRLAIITIFVTITFVELAQQPVQSEPITQLPLSDFINAQGNQDVWYPPEPALFAWTGRPPEYPRMGFIDYVGAADKWLKDNNRPTLGTTVTGTFTKKSIGENLAEYSVVVHAKNALAWCVRALDENGEWDGNTILFGAHVDKLNESTPPALGEVTFKATWQQAANEPIADVNLAANYGDPYRPNGWKLLSLAVHASASGPLQEAAGLGLNGTPGKMVISQTGLLGPSFGHGKGNLDGYPAEVMDLHAVGQ